ncbi:GDSL-type esterase/lipase family protein [Domibacillus sp. A3M-37]|uniref:GDSL-type esterase/lipase family protein n=1 Tax=Domibacillus sp. A3M-37 TaxID=2962037 RepID=UPI0020B80F6A|nr:GDSL-type esterase/lipase family protein [Domibacillus sp. A3M-37]MCP3763332.1 GDSL-type esterase/lipase family protein [Domibacillus sp. A3M-37]
MDFYPFHYLALGDSLTVGVGVPALDPGFVEHYACLSKQSLKKCIQYKKNARPGATTGDVLNMLHSPIVIEYVKHADIITITAGGNDLLNAAKAFIQNKNEKIFSNVLEQSQNNFSSIMKRIHNMEKQKEFIIRLTNLYNPFPNIPIAEEGIKTFNSLIYNFSKDKHVKVADIYNIVKGNERALLTRDGIHLNSRGYYQMALAFHKLGYFPVAR